MSNNSKNKIIIVILCILIAAIVTVIGFSLFNKNDSDKKSDGNNNEQSQAEQSDDTLPPKEPDIGESDAQVNGKDDDTTRPSDTPSDNVAAPNNAPTTSDNVAAPNNAPTTSDKPTENNSSGWEATIGSTEVALPANAPKSYKDFSLTKDMSAAEAYKFLNDFLNSKYSILLNKQNKVGDSYAPSDLITPSGCSYPMERIAGNALVELLSGARKAGVNDLVLYSGYRTVASQKNKYVTRTQKYLNQGYSQADAEAKAGEYIAPPGASEHHTGLAADVCSSTIVNKYGYLSDAFDTTESYKWMKEHCTEYGFIIRYTKGDEDITGYSYEPWHLRYLGVDHATACTELGYTYEEYHAMLIKLRDSAK